jgi:hypothetical protein
MMITPISRTRLAMPVDPDALKWRAAVIAAGGAVSDMQKRRVSLLIAGLKKSGVWSALDRLWLFAAENSMQALVDLKARAAATPVNNPMFTANRGYAGNGSNAYIDTGFNPGTGAPNYAQDNACEGCWVETPQASSGTAHRYISYNENIYTQIGQLNTTSYEFGVNNGAGAASYTFSTQTGVWHAQRTASNATALYQNGVSVQTSALASAVVSSRNFLVLAGNNAGSPYLPTDGRLAAVWMGKSIASPGALYSLLRTYMAAVGVA